MEDLKVMKKIFTKLLSITLIAANVLSLSLQPAISTNANSNQKPVLSHKKMTLTTGQIKKIKLKNVSISKAKLIKWKSSNKSVVTITANGTIHAKKKGKAKIMAKYNKKTYSCAVTVKNKSVTKPDPYDGDTNYPVSFNCSEFLFFNKT